MTVLNKIINLLEENNITFTITEHLPVRTSEEAAAIRGVELKTGVKAMVVKSKKDFHLIIIPADKKINWKILKQIINTKEIRFATVEEAEKITKVEMGSVPPFGNILGLDSYFDPSILENENINFNPGSKVHSINMRSKDLLSITNPKVIDLN